MDGEPNKVPVKSPDPAMSRSKRYNDSYNGTFDNNVGSKTINQDLKKSQDAATNAYPADNDTMDAYKGQQDALTDLKTYYDSQPAPIKTWPQSPLPPMQQDNTKMVGANNYKKMIKS